jgi:outer membrane protein assembly factor BamD
MPLLLRRTLAIACCGVALVACEGQKPAADVASLSYTEDSRTAYLEAMEVFNAKTWEEARTKLQEVRRIFGYSQYARLAELRLADVEFEQGKYSDAISGYRAFIRSHRSDDNVEYARYRIAKAAYLEVGDTPLLPPAEERDQGNTEDAHRELLAFAERYPSSRYHVDAGYMLSVVTQRLVRHELFVARYYLDEDNFDAAIARIDRAVKKYSGSGLDAEALVLKGETLLKKRARAEARAVFQQVISSYPGPFVEVAKRFLAAMEAGSSAGG